MNFPIWRGATLLTALAVVAALVSLGPVGVAQAASCSSGSGSYPPTSGNLTLGATVLAAPAPLSVSGSGFAPGASVVITLQGSTGSTLGSASASAGGEIGTSVIVPAGTPAGTYTVAATGANPAGGCLTLSATLTVTTAAVTTPPVATLVLGESTFVPGQGGSLSGTGCLPSTALNVYLDSTTSPPVGSSTSDAQGNFSATFTIPSDTSAGKHTLLVACAGAPVQSSPITVGAATTAALPITGADILPWALAILVLFAVGGALTIAGRRRSSRQQA